jgi:hypothetical protein
LPILIGNKRRMVPKAVIFFPDTAISLLQVVRLCVKILNGNHASRV